MWRAHITANMHRSCLFPRSSDRQELKSCKGLDKEMTGRPRVKRASTGPVLREGGVGLRSMGEQETRIVWMPARFTPALKP